MILFQIDKFNLFYNIENFKAEIKEDLVTASVDSSYFEGDYRTFKNRSKKTVISCTGFVASQHFLHTLRNLSENDEGRGEIKAYWIEKYQDFSSEYQTLSDTKEEKNQYKLYFNYVYIDIIAQNPVPNNNQEIKYQIQFNISLVYPNIYDITGMSNGFLITEEFLQTRTFLTYDTGVLLDSGLSYDNFTSTAQAQTLALDIKSQQLDTWFEKLTCCQCNQNDYIMYFDNILKPFIQSNSTLTSGIISGSVSRSVIDFRVELNNILQIYLSNPIVNPQVIGSQIISPIFFEKNPSLPNFIGNLNFTTNTWSTNGIIQIFRTGISGSTLNTNVNLLSVFDTVGQKIGISIKGQTQSISNISITCNSSFLRDNLKLLVIHPHNQKIYGCLVDKLTFITSDTFFIRGGASGLIDLENYILNGDLTIVNEMMDGTQEWLRFNPSYASDIYSPKINNFVIFSNKYQVPTQIIPTNTALVLQVYSQDENKLI